MKRLFVMISALLITAPTFCIAQKIQAAKDMTVVFGHSSWGAGTYYKILPDGSVTSFSSSNLPPSSRNITGLLLISGKRKSLPKPPKLRERISSRDLKMIWTEINKAGLIELRSGLIGKNEGCPDDILISDTSGDEITIKTDKVIKRFSSYCTGSPGSTADLYEKLYKRLYDLLKNLHIRAISQEEFYKDMN